MSTNDHELDVLRQQADTFEKVRTIGKGHMANLQALLIWLRDEPRPLDADPKLYVDAQHHARVLADLVSVINSKLLIAQSDAEIRVYSKEYNIPPGNLFMSIDGVKEMQVHPGGEK